MPLDSCDCEAKKIKSGLIEGAEWPSCFTQKDVTIGQVSAGRCEAGPDCPGQEDPGPCSFPVQWHLAGCAGAGWNIYERDAGSQDPWNDLGIGLPLSSDDIGAVILRPVCGKERRMVLSYAAQDVYEVIVRCEDCTAAGQGG